jgi:hypothetical protein
MEVDQLGHILLDSSSPLFISSLMVGSEEGKGDIPNNQFIRKGRDNPSHDWSDTFLTTCLYVSHTPT